VLVLGRKFSALFGFIQKRLGYPENFFVGYPPEKFQVKQKSKVRSSRWRFFNVLVKDQTDVRRLVVINISLHD
jgi:hypothetical protein